MRLWLVLVGGTAARPPRSVDVSDRPLPCVTSAGVGDAAANQWWVEFAERDPLERLTEPQARAEANRVSRETRA